MREQTLRALASPEAARFALETQLAGKPEVPGPERFALAFLSGRPPVLEDLGREELADAQQAVFWLSLVPRTAGLLPDPEYIQQLRERARLLEPLERLLRSPFQGRTAELDALRAYVGLPPHSDAPALSGLRLGFLRAAVSGLEPPLLIHGIGGIGKSTLLAKFLVKSLRDYRPGFPFAYIDFERPTLSLHEPATMIAEISRQFGMQYPALRAEFDALAGECEATAAAQRAGQSEVDDLYRLATTRGAIGRLSSSGLHAQAIEREQDLATRAGLLITRAIGIPAEAPGPPLVIALDSFEEAQYRGSPMLGRMWAFWAALQKAHPRLRLIVSGRAPIENPARRAELRTLALGDLDPQSAVALLVSSGVGDVATAEKLAERVGGHPLSLKLAAEAVRTVAEGGTTVGELVGSLPPRERDVNRKVDQLLVQGFLYDRILNHIPDRQARALARTGLALRTITPGLIKDVLAGPAGLAVESEDEARELFGRLARQQLMEPAGPEAIRHRADLRSIMLSLADKGRTAEMRQVGERAVAHFAALEGVEARAEEIYHRLRLRQSPRSVEERWLPGVERHLAGADHDLSARAAAFLTGRLGGHAPDRVMEEADQVDWERITAQEVDGLLAQGFVAEAATRLTERRPWTPGSELHPLLVDTLARLGRRSEARAEAEAAIDRAEEAGFPDVQLELLLQSARLAEEDGDLVNADRDLAAAEDIAGRLDRDFDALAALLARSQLAAASRHAAPEVDSRLAERLRSLPPDAMGRQPVLVRAAAAEVSRQDPQALAETIRVVGLPPGDDQALAALAGAIEQAAQEQPALVQSLLEILQSAVRSPGPRTVPVAGTPVPGAGPAGPSAPPPPAGGAGTRAPRPPGTPSALSSAPARTRTPSGAGVGSAMAGYLREARRLGTLDGLARQLLVVNDASGTLVSGVAAAMSTGLTPRPAAAATPAPEAALPPAPVEGNGP
ncbi:AAA family ATPase [Streptomyces bambusae]|nr:AAA family ATPase [Streptomyces bambusae]